MYKLKVLVSFQHQSKGILRRGQLFDEKDKAYVAILIGYKFVEVIALIAEKKAKET